MCKKCSNNSCSGGCETQDIANLQAQLAEVTDNVNQLLEDTKFLNRHPILCIEDADDIALFDFTSGLGSDDWTGWAVCDGQSQYSAKFKKNITTPNFTDRFLAQAGGEYAVGATGGLDTVALVIAELPVHNHGITDPGHAHAVTDPGHNHAVTDPGHTHVQNPHTHGYTDVVGDQPNYYLQPTPSAYTAVNSAHSDTTDAATAVNQNATTGLTVNNHTTGLIVNSNITGITTNNAGSGTAHENRPPFFAVIYIMKL